jgi:membrane-bound metal-dependent hydrolase YbcI (DUF457 family)
VDIATHALASCVLARGFFPRRRWPTFVGMIFAGTVADIDLLSALVGPSAYFAARRIYTHSLVGTVIIIVLSILFVRYLARNGQGDSLAALVLPLALAATLHVGMDLLQSEGVAFFWPFKTSRYAADCLPAMDVWILAFLLAGILVPELLRLVTSEIGAKDKSPRGRNGAIISLALIALFIGARVLLHSGAVASLDPHSYKGESARRVAAYPEALSLLTWHGVVETQSYLCLVSVPAAGRTFDANSADCIHKPEASPQLTAAQNTDVVQKYVSVMPFPRAIVARTSDGYEIVIRSMRDIAEHETRRRLAARVLEDSHFALVSEELIWVNDVRVR